MRSPRRQKKSQSNHLKPKKNNPHKNREPNSRFFHSLKAKKCLTLNKMTTDDLAYLSSIEKDFLLDIRNIIKSDYRKLPEKSINSARLAIKTEQEKGYELVVQALLIMDILQMKEFLSHLINNEKKATAKFVAYINKNETDTNLKLYKKIRTINTQSIVKNTIVDINVLNLRKTIRTHG